MTLASDIQRALGEMERALGLDGINAQTFTWHDKEVACVPSSLGRTVVIDREGNEVVIDLVLIVRRENFLTADSTLITIDEELFTADAEGPTPVSGREITFRGALYRIVSAKESGPRSHYELMIKDAASNG